MGHSPIPRVEVGVDTIAGARIAEAAGAHRVLLYAGAVEGGTTPSAGLIAGARNAAGLELGVMIRPRGGDFLYDDDDLAAMRRDILVARDSGADSVAFGVLRADASVDEDAMGALLEAARPMGVTFHRAFDMVREPAQALEALVRLGIGRVLTSGQAPSVLDGLERIGQIAQRAAGRISVVPAGRVDRSTVRLVLERTGATEVHVAPTAIVRGGMDYRNLRCPLGERGEEAEYERALLSARILGEMMAELGVSAG